MRSTVDTALEIFQQLSLATRQLLDGRRSGNVRDTKGRAFHAPSSRVNVSCNWLATRNLYWFSGIDVGDSFIPTVFRWANVAHCTEHARKVLLGLKPQLKATSITR